ncbi:hypothetical protein HDU85_003563 [Gaertneriomyces sp. JEL0708]|nr:hypothetical protein HDU85_003563 [Gaertneriomyces sp. JEL0708]
MSSRSLASSISFGDDSTSVPNTRYIPPPPKNRDQALPTPPRSPRKYAGRTNQSTIFTAPSTKSDPSPVIAPKVQKSDTILPMNAEKEYRFGKKMSGTAQKNQSSIDFTAPSIPPTSKPATAKIPSNQVHSRSSSPVPAPPAKPTTSPYKSSHFQSSISFGDDSPRAPDFSPKKSLPRPGKRPFPPQRSPSLAELAGGPVNATSNEAAKKVDPAAVDKVAGTTTGKWKVY